MVQHDRDYYEQPWLWERDFLCMPEERQRLEDAVQMVPEDVCTVLDAGCGNGAFLKCLSGMRRDRGMRLFATDFSFEAIRHVEFDKAIADIGHLPFGNKSFDLVACLDVLEHLPVGVFERALYELQRVSKRYILVGFPNDEDLERALVICPYCACRYHPNHHVRSFDKQRARDLFDEFYPVEIRETGLRFTYATYNKHLLAAYQSWLRPTPPHFCVCPQCGFRSKDALATEASDIDRRGLSGKIFDLARMLAKPVLRMIWPIQEKSRELLVLYERKEP